MAAAQVWAVVYDSDTPSMDGSRQVARMAERKNREEAEADLQVILARSSRNPKRNLRIETRWVSEWTSCE